MDSLNRIVTRVLKVVCFALFLLLLALVTWQIFARLILGDPSSWSEEAARYTLVWLGLVGITLATGEKADVAIDFFLRWFPTSSHRVLDLIASLSVFAFTTMVMMWGGWINATAAWAQRNPVLPINQGPLYIIVPITGLLMSYYIVDRIVRSFTEGYEGIQSRDPGTEVEL